MMFMDIADHRVASRLAGRVVAAAFVAVLVLLVVAGVARADFGITPGSFLAEGLDGSGAALTQAGAHPDATTAFAFNELPADANGAILPDEDIRDVRVDLPVGLVGDPHAVPTCPQDLFNTDGAVMCPPESQVGVITVAYSPYYGFGKSDQLLPVYLLSAPDGVAARFGFRIGKSNVVISATVRSGTDNGITATVRNVPGGILIFANRLTLWGVPADPSHDALRFRAGQGNFRPGDVDGNPLPSAASLRALMINPTRCGAPPVTKIAVRSWQQPDRWVTDEATSPAVTGCDRLRFEPGLVASPTTSSPDAPSGLNVALSFKQPDDPTGLAPAQLRDSTVTLPEGMTINPASAEGLGLSVSDTLAGRGVAGRPVRTRPRSAPSRPRRRCWTRS